jgi:hypothetical protein
LSPSELRRTVSGIPEQFAHPQPRQLARCRSPFFSTLACAHAGGLALAVAPAGCRPRRAPTSRKRRPSPRKSGSACACTRSSSAPYMPSPARCRHWSSSSWQRFASVIDTQAAAWPACLPLPTRRPCGTAERKPFFENWIKKTGLTVALSPSSRKAQCRADHAGHLHRAGLRRPPVSAIGFDLQSESAAPGRHPPRHPEPRRGRVRPDCARSSTSRRPAPRLSTGAGGFPAKA